MTGSRKYHSALKCAANNKYNNFRKIPYNDAIQNGHFVFLLGEHARGTTLNVYLLEESDEEKLNNNFCNQLNSENALLVYGPNSGNLGWNETYDFLIDGIIKEKLQNLFDDALAFLEECKKAKEERKIEEEKQKALAYKERIKRFEAIFNE